MIKQIWTVRSLPKLFNGLNISVSLFMLCYTILNVIVMENNVAYKLLFFGNSLADNSKYLLLIVPILAIMISSVIWYFSNVPKNIKYEINEVTKVTALKDYKNHREFLIGINFLLTLTLAFVGIESLNFAKEISGFTLLPAGIAFISIIPFAIYKIVTMKKIYEI